MAVRLLERGVSDLCLGKPPLSTIPSCATVRDALAALRRCPEPHLTVWTPSPSPSCLGMLTVVDIAVFLCSGDNISDPIAALDSLVISLLPKVSPVRLVDPQFSVFEALDEMLNGAQSLAVPIHPAAARRRPLLGGNAVDFCLVTQEDFARFFLSSIGVFSPIAALPVEALGLVRPDALAIQYNNSALSTLSLLQRATAIGTAIAVVDDDGRLVGEISPTALALFSGGLAAGSMAALSAGELMALADCGGGHSEYIRAVKARLRGKGLGRMVEFMEDDEETLSLLSTSASDSSSDEEAAEGGRRRLRRVGSYSARMGRRSEEAIVCHRRSSLVAVLVQAVAHRVSYVWVVEDDYELAGIVVFSDLLRLFRDHLSPPPLEN